MYFHSKLREKEQIESINKWKADDQTFLKVMSATGGFCTGTDSSNVVSLIVSGGARSLIDFCQIMGRAGGEGHQAEIHLLFNEGHLVRANGYQKICVDKRMGDFSAWAQKENTCRRKSLDAYLGGLK